MDIIDEITDDHRHIRTKLEALVSPGADAQAKKTAFHELSSLLGSHTEAEEKTIYAFAKKMGALQHFALQSFEEHDTIEAMMGKIKAAEGSAIRQARAKVLSDLLRHHLDEEEQEFLPALRQELSAGDSDRLAREYREVMDAPTSFDASEDDADDADDYGRVITMPSRRNSPPPLESFIP